ncbi:hypothetical protein [Microbacterium terrisoli]|uniref:hypothetical protein n=1 Tax=Microbacterium terrisoli TaxID=3242192 RepID=UPI0028041D2C|nr:hypothetical protein [Microbacterium protaetiae]
MDTLVFTGTLQILVCGECQIRHAIPAEMYQDRLNNGGNWWCPNGHKLHFESTENQKLEKQLSLEKLRRGWAETSLTATRDQLHATERSLRGHKAAKTRIKNRIAAGVCPCCNRSFQDLHRHMAGQHPDFTHGGAD